MNRFVFVNLLLSLLLIAGCSSSSDSLSNNHPEKPGEEKAATKPGAGTKGDSHAAVSPAPVGATDSSGGIGDDRGRSRATTAAAALPRAPIAPSAEADMRDEGWATADMRDEGLATAETDHDGVGVIPGADLTAGSFDDALNLDIFTDYWQDSSLAQSNIKGLEQPNWQELIPLNEDGEYDSLDLSFVIDVTGSMSDELSYLQAEIDSIAVNVADLFPNIKQRYSLVVYRDVGDDFIVKKFDFMSELPQFQAHLNGQQAAAGGDYPEAMDQALAESVQLQWGGQKNIKLLFLIADAPPHSDKIEETFNNIFLLKDMKVNIYPIAASGVAELAESIMRTSALLTGGQYIFLTDDSGIGNSHAEPKFPCYHVERLKDVIVRAISDELDGERSEPVEEKIIRTVGHPNKGVCVTQ